MVNSNSDLSVSVRNISKVYDNGKVKALNDLSFEVRKGELFGLIGPDGAGKSSLFRILTTLLLPDAGEATVEGFDLVKDYKRIRNVLGYMPGKFSLYQDLTVRENLEFFATVFNTSVEENRELIEEIYVQIEPFNDRPAGKLSGGMKQKLALCCALIHQPLLLLLDEPTTGVDPVSRKEFWEMLKRLKQKGITILVSTPYMDEAGLCDRVALIQEGDILQIDTPENIAASYPEPLYAIKATSPYELISALRNSEWVSTVNTFGEYVHITLNGSNSENLLSELKHKEISIVDFKPIQAGIEDCFIRYLQIKKD